MRIRIVAIGMLLLSAAVTAAPILFVEGTNQGGKLMRLSIAGGEPEFTGLENVRNQFSLSADGARLAFPRRLADGPEIVEVWALDNLLAKPAR